MRITRSQQGPVTVLSLSGPLIRDELNALVESVDECMTLGVFRIVLDIKNVPYLDSAALERIQDMVSSASKRGGDLRMAAANDICRDIFTATRMDSIVQLFDDREAAVRSLS